MAAASSSLALALLLLAAALHLSSAQTGSTTIYDQTGLRSALSDPNIGTIYFSKSIYVDPASFGTDQITIGRSVTIRPTSNLASASWRSQTPPVVNISTVYRVFNVQPGAKVTFTLTELVHKDRGWPFSAFLSYPPSSTNTAVVELVYAVNHIMQGPPLTIGSNYQYTPRPAAYPGTQQFYFIGDNWCLPFDPSRCYRQAALASDIAFTLPDMCNNWGFFTLRWSDVPIVLDAFLPDTCPPDTTPEQCVSSEMIKERMTNTGSTGCDPTSGR